MRLTILIITAAILFLFSCKSKEAQQKCLSGYIKEISADPEYKLIRSAANDTVESWATMNIKFFSSINRQEKWKIDSAVFFNEDKSKAIVLLLRIENNREDVFDNVDMLAAEKRNGTWHFYSQSMPTIGFDRRLNPFTTSKRPYTFKELSDISRKELIRGGYYKKGSCNINYDYVNGWFEKPLAEYHQEFMKNKVN